MDKSRTEVDSQIFRLDSGRWIGTCRPLGFDAAHIAGGARFVAGRLGDVGHDAKAYFGERGSAAGIVIGVIQHFGILVPAQQGVPIGVGHGTQVQAGRLQVDGVSVEGHS